MPYDNMPFNNKQAAKSDRYGRLTAAREKLVSDFNASGKSTPEGTKAFKTQLNKLDIARRDANPTAFKESIAAKRGPESGRVQTTVGGTKTSFKERSTDNLTQAKRRGGN